MPVLVAVGVLAFGASALGAASGSDAAASGSNENSLVPVKAGISAAALPDASVFGETPSNTPETVSFVLTEQNLAELEARVEQGFQGYLSVSQFASAYGQTPANISQLLGYLAQGVQ